MEKNSQYLGIICITLAQVFFTTQDMAIKLISGNYALHQIILIRASVAILFTLLVIVPIDGGYKYLLSKRLGLHLLRGFGIVVANLCFFTSLVTLPLAEAVAIFFYWTVADYITVCITNRRKGWNAKLGSCFCGTYRCIDNAQARFWSF